MNRCPISYNELTTDEDRYSRAGLRLLSRSLRSLSDLEYSAQEQRREAMARASKMSIQGVQPKLSARLSTRRGRFEIVDQGGTYILKPQVEHYRSLPENEDLTMRLASTVGIEVPKHGMVYSSDDTLTYFIKRFDRVGRSGKRSVEDFAQLAGATRDTKYDFSMERVAELLDMTTFPAIERLELFRRTLFSFLVGNEDMHLKNFSVISEPLGPPATAGETVPVRVRLSPAYDLVNTTLAVPGTLEEIALPLRGKKRRLSSSDLIDYYARERLKLTDGSIDDVLETFRQAVPSWAEAIAGGFLEAPDKTEYRELVEDRSRRLGF